MDPVGHLAVPQGPQQKRTDLFRECEHALPGFWRILVFRRIRSDVQARIRAVGSDTPHVRHPLIPGSFCVTPNFWSCPDSVIPTATGKISSVGSDALSSGWGCIKWVLISRYCLGSERYSQDDRWECKIASHVAIDAVPADLHHQITYPAMAKTSVVYRTGYHNRNKHQIEPLEGLDQHFTRFWCFYPSYAPCRLLQPAKAPQISKSRRWC